MRSMGNKALLTWNIRPGHEREHFQRIREFVDRFSALGLELEDAWYTVYGDAPQILLGVVAQGRNDELLENVLNSEEWEAMIADLKHYVTDYQQRIVVATGNFQF